MKPINKEKDFRKLGELKALLKSLPRLGEELDGFAVDIEKVYEDQPIMPLGDLWE